MERLIFKNETYQLIGVCMEVHRILGHSFSEIVYKDAIEVEAASKKIGLKEKRNMILVIRVKY